MKHKDKTENEHVPHPSVFYSGKGPEFFNPLNLIYNKEYLR